MRQVETYAIEADPSMHCDGDARPPERLVVRVDGIEIGYVESRSERQEQLTITGESLGSRIEYTWAAVTMMDFVIPGFSSRRQAVNALCRDAELSE